jgi:hypothetical protein
MSVLRLLLDAAHLQVGVASVSHCAVTDVGDTLDRRRGHLVAITRILQSRVSAGLFRLPVVVATVLRS